MFNNKELSQEAKNTLYILGNQGKSIDYQRLNFKRDKNVLFDFQRHLLQELFNRKIRKTAI